MALDAHTLSLMSDEHLISAAWAEGLRTDLERELLYRFEMALRAPSENPESSRQIDYLKEQCYDY